LLPSDSAEEIAKKLITYAHRAAAKAYHPDHGGDKIVMGRITEAKKLLEAALRR
jgi:hypothetical protein